MIEPATSRVRRLLGRARLMFGTAWLAAPGLALVCLVVAFGAAVLGLVYPLGFRAIVDGALEQDRGRVLAGVAIVVVAVPGSWVLQLVGAGLNSRLTDEASLRLAMHVGRLVNLAPYLEHFERPDYLAQIDTIRERRRTLAGAPAQTLGLVRSGIQFLGAAVLLALVWPPLLIVPLLAIAPAIADRKAAAIEKRSDDELADERRLLGEMFSLASSARAARELRTFGATEALQARYRRLGDQANRQAMRAAYVAAAWEAAGWVLYALGFAAAILVLVLRAAHGSTTAGQVVEAVSVLRRAQRQVAGATGNANSFGAASTTADRMLWLEEYVGGIRPGHGCSAPERIRDGIHFDNVSFTYPGQDQPVLHGVNLTLQAGTTVAVVGDNGAGKSTLIKLLTGMYRPTEGRITVDGQDLAAIDPERWRSRLTGAFQDFVQFSMTVGQGVGAGDLPHIDDPEAVTDAIERAGGGAMVKELPEGLGTLLGPWVGGRSLSEGQWQRLALARGLMRREPLLVVLDEPTATLDPPTEAALFERYRDASRIGATAEMGTVTVLVSHRFSTVHAADQIVVVESGQVVEIGNHATLMARQGLYAELYSLQARGYTTE